MKLFVVNPDSNEKIPLTVKAKDRKDLLNKIGAEKFTVDESMKEYSINDVRAELSSGGKEISAVVGGLLGLVGGGVGALAGAAFGTFIGMQSEEKEKMEVEHFNNSRVVY